MTRWLAALAIVVSLPQIVFKGRVDGVLVDVLVTRGNRPVPDLTASDFALRDSGVLQKVNAIALEDVPLNLLLTLDVSRSVTGEPLQHLKAAAHAAVAALGPGDRASLLAFSQIVRRSVPFSNDPTLLHSSIDSVESEGATSLNDAAFAALAMREGVDGRVLILLFTDGIDTASWLSPLTVIEQARRSDVVFVGVRLDAATRLTRTGPPLPGARAVPLSLGPLRKLFFDEPQLYRHEFLAALTDETGGELIVANQSRDLSGVFLRIVSEFKTRYVLSYTPSNVAPSGWHPIEVRLKNSKGDIRARRGYTR